jgi:hypothetical protein
VVLDDLACRGPVPLVALAGTAADPVVVEVLDASGEAVDVALDGTADPDLGLAVLLAGTTVERLALGAAAPTISEGAAGVLVDDAAVVVGLDAGVHWLLLGWLRWWSLPLATASADRTAAVTKSARAGGERGCPP